MITKLVGTLIAGTIAVGMASTAHATLLSFSITGSGNFTVNTGDITAATATKTIPGTELVGGTTTPATFAVAGLVTGAPVAFSVLTLPTANGPFAFTLTAGNITASFTSVTQASKVATGATTAGSISEQFNGLITADTSVGTPFLGQTASLSETCTQTGLGAAISCSESFITPGLPVIAEPASIGIFGLVLLGLGMARRNWAA